MGRSHGGAARCNQVIDQRNPVPLADRVVVDLDPVLPIFERIVHADGSPRQLVLLADGDEAQPHLPRQGRPEDEAARLDACNHVHVMPFERRLHAGDGKAKAVCIAQHGRDIAELDAGLGEVGNGADQAPQGIIGHLKNT